MSKNDSPIKLEDKITKQDLVDYAIQRKVEELDAKAAPINERRTELEKIKKDLAKDGAKIEREVKTSFVEKEYKPVLDLMKQHGNPIVMYINRWSQKLEHNIKLDGSDDNGTLNYFLQNMMNQQSGSKDDIVIMVTSIEIESMSKKKGKPVRQDMLGMMFSHPHMRDYGAGGFAVPVKAFFIVNGEEVNLDDLKDITEEYNKVSSELAEIGKELQAIENEKYQVKHSAGRIKAEIVEQALGGTEEGKAMLENLQKIDFTTIKKLH